MKLSRIAGATSNILQIFIRDSSSTTGAGLTGLTSASAGLTAYYHCSTDTTATAISLVTMTVGTFTSGGFKEIDATNMPGWYQFCPPDAALASGDSVGIHLKGATNMAPLPIEIDLDTQVDLKNIAGSAVSTSTAQLGVNVVSVAGAASNIKKNQALNNFMFLMTDSTSHNPDAGLTVTATRSIDGAAFASCANSVTGVANGWYTINLAATDLNGNNIALRFTATGADDRDILIVTQP